MLEMLSPSIIFLINCPSYKVNAKVFFYISNFLTSLNIRVTRLYCGKKISSPLIRTPKKRQVFLTNTADESYDQALLGKVELYEIYKCQ